MSNSSFDSTELPVLEARTQCVLIPRDPHYIYAYWNYTPQDLQLAMAGLKATEAKFILRIYDLTTRHSWDIDVGFSTKNCYIHTDQDNADYYVEIGISGGQNHFTSLVKSNTVHTPPLAASKRDDLIWQDIKFNRDSRPYVREDIATKRQARKMARQKAKTYELTSHDMDTYYMNPLTEGSPSMEQVLKGKWPDLSVEKVRSLIRTPGLMRRLHPGASDKFLSEEEMTEEQGMESMGSSENLPFSSHVAASAGGSEERLKKRKFFFEVWTELIVHGRTEPDAVVWLNSKGVQLNPDGTFSLRYALPDGDIPLGFIAQSSDALEQRHIYTRVERAKTIGFPKMLGEYRG